MEEKEKKDLIDTLQSHCELIREMVERFHVMPMDSFYVGDTIKKFHESMNDLDIALKGKEFSSVSEYEPYLLMLELIRYNRVKIPLKKKFEDLPVVLQTYLKNVKLIISKTES